MQSAARIVALALLTALAACDTMSNPAQQTPDTSNRTAAIEAVPGQYIVVLQDNVADPATVAKDLVNGAGGSLLRVYTSAIKGFAARLSAPAAATLQGNPLVASVEADQVMRADVTQAMDANGDPWGLDRIDQGALPLSRTYTYTSTGAGVHAYIIDTGIWTLHPECTESPSGAPSVFTVAASTKTDAKASYSNWGTCGSAPSTRRHSATSRPPPSQTGSSRTRRQGSSPETGTARQIGGCSSRRCSTVAVPQRSKGSRSKRTGPLVLAPGT